MHRSITALCCVWMAALLVACSDRTSDEASLPATIVQPNIVEPVIIEPEIVEPEIVEPVVNAPVLARPKLGMPFVGGGSTQPTITVSHAKIRLPLGGRDVTAGYVTVLSPVDDALVAVSSPMVEAIELHTHTMTDGVMRMARVEAFDLPEGVPVSLAPGGDHLMLFGLGEGPDDGWGEGDIVPLTLAFASGQTLDVDAVVLVDVTAGAGASGHGEGHRDHQYDVQPGDRQ